MRSERRATEGVLRLGVLANPHTPFYAETKSHRADSGVDTNMYMEAHRKLQTYKYTQAQTQNYTQHEVLDIFYKDSI